MSMVPSKDLLKAFNYQSDKGDRNILGSNEMTVHRPLIGFKMGYSLLVRDFISHAGVRKPSELLTVGFRDPTGGHISVLGGCHAWTAHETPTLYPPLA